MKNALLLAMTVVVLVMTGGCKSTKIDSQWAGDKVTIDGDASDWEGLSLQHIKEYKAMLGIANDSSAVYVLFSFNDQGLARKIHMFGTTVWVDAEGKKHKEYGIRYAGSQNMILASRPEREKADAEAPERMRGMMERMSTGPEPGTIVMIESGEETSMPENNPHGPKAASAIQDGGFCYELSIPLPVATSLEDEISLCWEVGGISEMDRSQMGGDMGGMPGPGGMSGGGMGGGPRGGGPRGRGGPPGDVSSPKQTLGPQEKWLKITLADRSSPQIEQQGF